MKTREELIADMNGDCPNDFKNLFIWPLALVGFVFIIASFMKKDWTSIEIQLGYCRVFLLWYTFHFSSRLRYKMEIKKLSNQEIKTEKVNWINELLFLLISFALWLFLLWR